MFLKSSLDANVELAKKTADTKGQKMQIIADHKLCQKNNMFCQKRYNLLTKKGCLPYESIVSYKSLFKKGFPEWEDFRSELKGKMISLKTYKHVKEIWNEFECKNL